MGVATACFRASFLLALLQVVGCAQGHCRHQKDAPAVNSPAVTVEPPAAPAPDRIFVYKYDGSLQCGMGQAISVEAMAKQLKGISIFSRAKKSDGLMHIQVCGSITGMANIYEIPASFEKQAESKGFKKWTFE